MKTDPRIACANARELLFWAFVHDLIAHGFMALSLWSKWSLMFHDWTSHKAWPRPAEPTAEVWPKPVVIADVHFFYFNLEIQNIAPGIWRAKHPHVNHAFTTCAISEGDMKIKAMQWFCELSTEFGGRFKLI